MSRVNTYADPMLSYADPMLSSSAHAPITIVSPSIETLEPNLSSAAPLVPAVSLSTCVQPEARSPAVLRVNTYADPLADPSSSSPYAPITIVSPSIETLVPK